MYEKLCFALHNSRHDLCNYLLLLLLPPPFMYSFAYSICSSRAPPFRDSLLMHEHHPRAVNLLIYSRRFLEFCQPRLQSALVLFTLFVVCTQPSRCFPKPTSSSSLPFRFVLTVIFIHIYSSSSVLSTSQIL